MNQIKNKKIVRVWHPTYAFIWRRLKYQEYIENIRERIKADGIIIK